jgi:acyl-CoA thioester hydrolase
MKDFYIEKKVYYHDTDCGGVVYYGNYLRHLEEARTEYFLTKGISLKELTKEGMWFVVAKIIINYKSPARYQDILKISTRVERIKGALIELYQKVTKNNTIILEAKTTIVLVNKDFKPIPMAPYIKESFLT